MTEYLPHITLFILGGYIGFVVRSLLDCPSGGDRHGE